MVVVCEVNNLSLFILPNFSRLFDPGSDLWFNYWPMQPSLKIQLPSSGTKWIAAPKILRVPILKSKHVSYFFLAKFVPFIVSCFLNSVRANLLTDVFVKVLQFLTVYVSWCLQVVDLGMFVVCSRLQETGKEKTHKICKQQDFPHKIMSYKHTTQSRLLIIVFQTFFLRKHQIVMIWQNISQSDLVWQQFCIQWIVFVHSMKDKINEKRTTWRGWARSSEPTVDVFLVRWCQEVQNVFLLRSVNILRKKLGQVRKPQTSLHPQTVKPCWPNSHWKCMCFCVGSTCMVANEVVWVCDFFTNNFQNFLPIDPVKPSVSKLFDDSEMLSKTNWYEKVLMVIQTNGHSTQGISKTASCFLWKIVHHVLSNIARSFQTLRQLQSAVGLTVIRWGVLVAKELKQR